MNKFLSFVAIGHLFGNAFLTMFLLLVAGTNYPGGVAISRFHRLAAAETNVTIHIDNLAAQSGVSRFSQINPDWIYSKEEHLFPGEQRLHQFDYLLTEARDKYSDEMRLLGQTHEILEFVECFNSIGLQYKSLLPVKIKTKPCIFIMKRREGVDRNRIRLNFDEIMETSTLGESEPLSDPEFPTFEFIEREEDDEEEQMEFENEVKGKELNEEELNGEDDEEPEEEPPRFPKPKKNRNRSKESTPKLPQVVVQRKTSSKSRMKIKEILEENAHLLRDDDEGATQEQKRAKVASYLQKASSSSMLKSAQKIIKEEKLKQLASELGKIDFSRLCNLDRMSTRECLKKIIDEQYGGEDEEENE